jgi:hypothetical protein
MRRDGAVLLRSTLVARGPMSRVAGSQPSSPVPWKQDSVVQLSQITPRLSELEIWSSVLASLLRRDGKELEALSRQIVTLFPPDTLV